MFNSVQQWESGKIFKTAGMQSMNVSLAGNTQPAVKMGNWLALCCVCGVLCENRISYSNEVQFLRKFNVHRAPFHNVTKTWVLRWHETGSV
jgi:hypothetical protein